MTSSLFRAPRIHIAALPLALMAAMMAGCAQERIRDQSRQDLGKGDYEQAVRGLEAGLKAYPESVTLRSGLIQAGRHGEPACPGGDDDEDERGTGKQECHEAMDDAEQAQDTFHARMLAHKPRRASSRSAPLAFTSRQAAPPRDFGVERGDVQAVRPLAQLVRAEDS